MHTRRWLQLALATALLGGCAHESRVIDERVARLPPAARQRIVDLQQHVNVAASNLDTARVARDEARQFLRVTDDELRAARARDDAARHASQLARQARDAAMLDNAERELRTAEQHVIASRLKRDYADRLLALRDAEVSEREAQLNGARADLDAARIAELNRDNLAVDRSAGTYSEAQRQARADQARRRQRVAQLSGEVAYLRSAWEQQRRAVASRATGEPLLPPPPPSPLPPPVAPREAPTDVNEGPAAPQSMPNPNFTH